MPSRRQVQAVDACCRALPGAVVARPRLEGASIPLAVVYDGI